MSKASNLRRRRQIKRRLGAMKQLNVIAIQIQGDEVLYHYRARLPLVFRIKDIEQKKPDLIKLFDSQGFLRQDDALFWLWRRATMSDIGKLASRRIVGFPAIRLTPRTTLGFQDFSLMA